MAQEPSQPVPHPAWVEVSGFKSLSEPTRVHLRPLTVLAGANASGKTSFMQPLLLLKQTLEVPYDPGPLALKGEHVTFTSLDQVLSRVGKDTAEAFSVTFGPVAATTGSDLQGNQRRGPCPPVRVRFFDSAGPSGGTTPPKSEVDVLQHGQWVALDKSDPWWLGEAFEGLTFDETVYEFAHLLRQKCERKRYQVTVSWYTDFKETSVWGYPLRFTVDPVGRHTPWISSILHIRALRGNPKRSYPEARVREDGGWSKVDGPFGHYTASLLLRWQEQEDARRLGLVRNALKTLGLTWTVRAKRVSSVEVELKVGRTRARGRRGWDLVDIADTGFGISQVMPLLVALAAASPGQMVYVEQPELHLHPRAQWQMGKILAQAAARGVLVVAETHSSLLLRGVQQQVASGALAAGHVGLHWFWQEPKTGVTRVALAEVDERGAFGDWPVDFTDVEMEADEAWLDAAFGEEAR